MGEITDGIKNFVDFVIHKEVPVTSSDGSRLRNATAAVRLGNELMRQGLSKREAAEMAVHEKDHADIEGGGTWGITVNRFTGKITGAYFMPDDERDLERVIRSLVAPDKSGRTACGMSERDIQLLRAALRKQRQERRGNTR